jgi:hypothetical protein
MTTTTINARQKVNLDERRPTESIAQRAGRE